MGEPRESQRAFAELPNRRAPTLARLVPTRCRPLEHDAIGVYALNPVASDHERVAVVEPERTVIGVDAEQLGRRPAQAMRLSAEAGAEVER